LFLLSAPAIPDGDLFRRQAAAAKTSGAGCACGCASIDLQVDAAAAPQARLDLPNPLAEATTDDIAGVHRASPLSFYDENGMLDPNHRVTNDDLNGAIGLILWVESGWLSGIEIWSAGDFVNPPVFPPAQFFEAPRVSR
jgi:uncharacterized protein YuzE